LGPLDNSFTNSATAVGHLPEKNSIGTKKHSSLSHHRVSDEGKRGWLLLSCHLDGGIDFPDECRRPDVAQRSAHEAERTNSQWYKTFFLRLTK